MNGLSSNTDRHTRQQSSLDALSRTIEGLEARIESLVARQGATPRAGYTVERGHQPEASDVSEIVRRQKLLDQERTNLRSRLQRAPADAGNGGGSPAHSEQTLRDIAEALVGLRAEIKRDIGEGLAGELSALRYEVAALKGAEHGQALPPELRADLIRLADCIERLGERTGAVDLHDEFDALRATIEGATADASIRALERHRAEFEEHLAELDPPALKAGIAGLADRIEALGEALSDAPGSRHSFELEQRLTDLAAAVETLAHSNGRDGVSFEETFVELGDRLDEISRAVVAVGARIDRSADEQALARLESRVAGIARQMDDLTERDPAGELTPLVEALAIRIDDLANAESVNRLGDQLDQLSTLIASGPAQGDLSELAEHLIGISVRIDALEQGAVNTVLAEKLDGLAARIDDIAAAGHGQAIDPHVFDRLEALVERAETTIVPHALAGMEVLEERLADIARRLDETQNSAPGNDAALRSLETQIANLSELMSRPGAQGPDGGAALMEPRLAAIEEHLATNDEYVIEAARQAAEAVIEAYGRGTVGGSPTSSRDLAVISELAEDLRALEELNRESDQRTARAFDAVHDTLVKIAEHLENLDPARPSENVVAVEPDHLEMAAPVFGQQGTERGERQVMTPAAAAAEAAIFAAHDDEAGSERPGFFAGLRRMRSTRDEPVAEEEKASRRDVDDAPSIDPSETFDPIAANEPLEPGSGAPDISRIIQKVRAAQAGDMNDVRSEAEKADFIAAARRAAQAAAAEVETIGGEARNRKGSGLAEILKRRRKPILMAVGAVLLAVMSWPLVSALLAGTPAHDVASRPAEPSLTKKAEAIPPASAETTETPDLPTVAVVPQQVPTEKAAAETAAPGIDPASTAATEPVETKAADEAPSKQADTTGPAKPAPVDVAAAPSAKETAALPVTQPDKVGEPEAPAIAAAPSSPVAADAGAQETEVAALPAVPDAVGPQTLRAAAEKGEPAALFEIGSRFTEGRGVDVDLAAAAKWYRAAAERGLAPAEYRLANLYEKGSGVDRDLDAAKDWYRKAAEAGNASAMHNLAVLNAMGTDGKANYEAAADWFRKAAGHGVHDSQFNLGILYAQGNGVPRDLAKSYQWFAIAAKAGDKDAAEKRDEVAKALDKATLDGARAAAEAWKAEPLDPAANTVDVPTEWSGADTRTAAVDMTKAVRNIQAILNNNGFDAGQPDGIMGDRTRAAIRAFQESVGQDPTGQVTDALIKELLDRNGARAKT